MGLARSRTVTLTVALATLTSNILSSLLFAQLPDDPYHLASNFGLYLHFANILSVFGFIGALRQHALSISFFSTYLLLDTILCAVPRLLLLSLLHPLSTTFCTPSSVPSYATPLIFTAQTPPSPSPQKPSISTSAFQQEPFDTSITWKWTEEDCYRVVGLAQLALAAGVVAACCLQGVGALCVREYARMLWREEDRVLGRQEGGLILFEDRETGDEKC
ncbi:hypothetical protein LSUB1_G008370 [Lachnellula subtilissima]|uniref:Uncharacterized protein n=1 Tax=Lachnellula subtilissima TaxID=602034 RepID=A0A8H8U6J1_9HELO|nr:hypothetical protein LSUB1_G008370 [Lachnellula subtilissima]